MNERIRRARMGRQPTEAQVRATVEITMGAWPDEYSTEAACERAVLRAFRELAYEATR